MLQPPGFLELATHLLLVALRRKAMAKREPATNFGTIRPSRGSRSTIAGACGDCDGGLRQRALLGPAVPCHGPSNPADQSALCEAVRQRIEKRRGGCRSNLRSSLASDDAFRAGQIDRTTGPAVASSCSRACRLCSNRPYQPYARTARRIWCHSTPGRLALHDASDYGH